MRRKLPLFGGKTALLLATSMLVLTGATSASAKQRSSIKATFENPGVDLDAYGSMKAAFKYSKAKMSFKVRNLEPEAAYTLLVDGQPEATFVTDDEGDAKVKLKSYTSNDLRLLDFEPREGHIEIHDGTNTVLEADLSDDWEALTIKNKEETNLVVHEEGSRAKVKARHYVRYDGTERFSVYAKRLPAGTYTLFVDGIERATVVPSSKKGKAKLKFESIPTAESHILLDFDPRSAEVALVRDGVTIASGEMQAKVRGVNVCEVERDDVYLTATIDAPYDATAEVNWRQDSDCSRRLDIEVDRVAEGRTYDLYVGGEFIASLDDDEEISFRANVGEYDEDDVHLDFDPKAGTIEIRDGETVLFADHIDTALATNSGGACHKLEIEGHLFTIDGSDAQAIARFETEEDCDRSFEIDVTGATAGDYAVNIESVFENGFEVEDGRGDVEFESDEEGADRLDFEPRGALVEVSKDGVVIFNRIFPTQP